MNTILGTSNDDTLKGSRKNDRIRGKQGNDTISGKRGKDTLLGGSGNDLLKGNRGNDRLIGGSGDDKLIGGLGKDLLKGSGGNDTLLGGKGNDKLIGGAGNDSLAGGIGNNKLIDGNGNDTLNGGGGFDVLRKIGTGTTTFEIAIEDYQEDGHVTIEGYIDGDTIDLIGEANEYTVEYFDFDNNSTTDTVVKFTDTEDLIAVVEDQVLNFNSPNIVPENTIDLLIPAYGNPCCGRGSEMWDNLINVAQNSSVQLNVILNPQNGPGSTPIDPNYINPNGADPLLDLKNAGGVVYGYVSTDRGNRNIEEVKDDIDKYYDSEYYLDTGFQIDGIFLDEMSTDLANVSYYQEVQTHIKEKNAVAKIIGNPGTSTIEEYANVVDILVTFENTGEVYRTEYTAPSWVDNYSAEQFAHLIHSESNVEDMFASLELAKSRNVGMIYVTDETFVDNPWDNLAGYWDLQVEELSSLTEPENQFRRQNQSEIIGSSEVNDLFEVSLVSGNLNGDVFDDSVIGIPNEDLQGSNYVDAGGAVPIYGATDELNGAVRQFWDRSFLGNLEAGDRFTTVDAGAVNIF